MQGDYESLEALCTIMKNEDGMKKMNKLGKKMLECLLASKLMFVLYIHYNIMYVWFTCTADTCTKVQGIYMCVYACTGLHTGFGARGGGGELNFLKS